MGQSPCPDTFHHFINTVCILCAQSVTILAGLSQKLINEVMDAHPLSIHYLLSCNQAVSAHGTADVHLLKQRVRLLTIV